MNKGQENYIAPDKEQSTATAWSKMLLEINSEKLSEKLVELYLYL